VESRQRIVKQKWSGDDRSRPFLGHYLGYAEWLTESRQPPVRLTCVLTGHLLCRKWHWRVYCHHFCLCWFNWRPRFLISSKRHRRCKPAALQHKHKHAQQHLNCIVSNSRHIRKCLLLMWLAGFEVETWGVLDCFYMTIVKNQSGIKRYYGQPVLLRLC